MTGTQSSLRPPGSLLPRRRPRIGDMVHYVSFGSAGGRYPQACRAAIVTAVGAWVDTEVLDDGPGLRTLRQRWDRLALALTVENPTGTFKDLAIPHADGEDATIPTELCGGLAYRGGTWHHPFLS